MLFNSFVFSVFLAVFFPLYLLVRRDVFARNVFLIVSSYVFYGWWDPRFLILVAVSTSVDYVAALGAAGKPVSRVDRLKSAAFLLATTAGGLGFASREDLWLVPLVLAGICTAGLATYAIDRAPEGRRRRYWLYLSLVTNLGVLALFKYFNFFATSIAAALAAIGIEIQAASLSIILPVGLSFYTFQALSRTIDCYRGRFDPAYSIVDYAAYHAFFPQLVAGPIERAGHLMPQFERVLPLTRGLVGSGALLFVWGLYQKLVIADNLAPLASGVFDDPEGGTAAATLVGVLAFAFQIYCDFCGYSNMARGLARCLGFDLVANFDLPYFARTPSEFWRRWHISLSTWLRDYLYIPLGGSRGGTAATCRNLMATMLLGGLWHGAAWTFVAWGGLHGLIQAAYRALKVESLIERHPFMTATGVLVHGAAWLATMGLVTIGWVFFRARSFGDAMAVLQNLAGVTGYSFQAFGPLLQYVVPLIAAEIYQRASNRQEIFAGGPFVIRYVAFLFVMFSLLALSAPGGQEFIYFDF